MIWPPAIEDLQLDVVGLLAVIGESAMSTHSQTATATRWALIPRLIPAPQALLRHSRPFRLPPVSGVKVAGIRSGNFVNELNYFPNLIHGIEQLPPYAIQTISITHKDKEKQLNGPIPVKQMGPLVLLSIFGALCAAGLLGLAIYERDGMALLAILLLSVTSTCVGWASKWRPSFSKRNYNRDIPPSDIMIVGRQGAFLHVKCTEQIARELYFGQEVCEYDVGQKLFQVLAGCATFMLMAAVIAMANCTFNVQAALGLAYIVMNGLYWLAALVPGEWHWELGMYEVKQIESVQTNSYSEVLIEAIGQAGGAKWVSTAGVAPKSDSWSDWLREAEKVFLEAKESEEKTGEKGVDLRARWERWNPNEKLTMCLKYGTLRRATEMGESENKITTVEIETITTSHPTPDIELK